MSDIRYRKFTYRRDDQTGRMIADPEKERQLSNLLQIFKKYLEYIIEYLGLFVSLL
jgi:hypothetical protein